MLGGDFVNEVPDWPFALFTAERGLADFGFGSGESRRGRQNLPMMFFGGNGLEHNMMAGPAAG